MESNRITADPDPLHFCHWRELYRLCRQKSNECSLNRPGLAMGGHLHSSHHNYLAPGSTRCQHPFRAISFFLEVYKEDRGENGLRKKSEVRRRKSEVEGKWVI